jgi:D-aminoacyl-tRNA deacylase
MVVQRVSRASVTVGGSVVASIGPGLAVLVGVAGDDGPEDLAMAASKLTGLRVFPDGDGRMNLSVGEVDGEVLVVSQFTLLGEVSRGRRPSFTGAAPPEIAARAIEMLVDLLRQRGARVSTGVFGGQMEVELVNSGPVTLVVDIRQGRVVPAP